LAITSKKTPSLWLVSSSYSGDLLTRVYGLPKERLYVTYFGGDVALGLPPDSDAKQMWLDIGVPEDHVIPGSVKDNFWEMGDQGPYALLIQVRTSNPGMNF
jgi:alanyl-tRNA synthetase